MRCGILRVVIELPDGTVPVLGYGDVLVRPYEHDDSAGIVERSSDVLTKQWTTIPRDLSLRAARTWIAEVGQKSSTERMSWAIEVDGRYAGHVGLRPEADGGHIHFDTCPWVRGRGVAGLAVRLVSRWALTELAWSAVIWRAHVGNTASAKTAWRAGFAQPITVPYSLEHEGRLVDGWYAIMTASNVEGGPIGLWGEYLPHDRTGTASVLGGASSSERVDASPRARIDYS